MSFLPQNYPPEDALLASLADLLRAGLPELFPSAVLWTGDLCPAGHWIMPENARLYRYDTTEKIVSPAAALSLFQDSVERNPNNDLYWHLFPMVEIIWPRDLVALETQQIRNNLQTVFTRDLPAPVATGQQRALSRLSRLPDTNLPGIQVLALTSILCEKLKAETGHPLFRLSFQVLCSGIQPLA